MKVVNVGDARRKRDRKLRLIRRRRIVTVSRWAALALAVFFLLGLAYNSSFWQVEQIKVSGNGVVPRAKIIKLAAVKSGTNLLKIPKERIQARLLSSPWIQSVTLRRHLPRTLGVEIVERKPSALLSHLSAFYLLDQEGFVIATDTPGQWRVPIITDVTLKRKPVIGRQLNSPALADALASLKGLDSTLRASLSSVTIPSLDKVAFYTSNNLEIIFGKSTEIRKKNYVINKILEKTGGKVIYINVTAPNNPVVRKLET